MLYEGHPRIRNPVRKGHRELLGEAIRGGYVEGHAFNLFVLKEAVLNRICHEYVPAWPQYKNALPTFRQDRKKASFALAVTVVQNAQILLVPTNRKAVDVLFLVEAGMTIWA